MYTYLFGDILPHKLFFVNNFLVKILKIIDLLYKV